MRLIKPVLSFVALASLVGCGHAASTQAPPATQASTPHALAVDNEQRAKDLVIQKFTAEGTEVVFVEVVATTMPFVYDFTCSFRRLEYGQVCLYDAKGQLELTTGKLSSKHKVDYCLGLARP